MASVLAAVQTTSAATDLVRVRRALLSVSDKTGIVAFATALTQKFNVELVSTGGTAKALRAANLTVKDVADVTGFPEMLDGRVKTLHPAVHGGIMYVRGNADHEAAIEAHGIQPIDLVVLNLYPFEEAIKRQDATFETSIENIDIGGPSMLRSSAKNHRYVTVATRPEQYDSVLKDMEAHSGQISYALRKQCAAEAFALTARYDAAIANWFACATDKSEDSMRVDQVNAAPETLATPTSTTTESSQNKILDLKYGCNPHQKPAALYANLSLKNKAPFRVLNGRPGYINMLDALNAYQLVKEVDDATQLPSAASFKHVSPAGAAVGVPLNDLEKVAYDARDELTPLATAYVRARQADPLSSFGDFVGLSRRVDVETAKVLKKEVSDGVIAPGFDADALEILAAKKGGNFVCLEMDESYRCSGLEYREVFGVGFLQRRNTRTIANKDLEVNVPTKRALTQEAKRDLVLASIVCKYTQSNSVAFSKNGQCVGVGAGQQSRVDCVKLAASKVKTWWLRFHPTVMNLPFKEKTKRQDKVNARVRFVEGNLTAMSIAEKRNFDALFVENTDVSQLDLDPTVKTAHLNTLDDVALASDAFFPFRDNIDVAATVGVKFVAQAGGSVQDDAVVQACDDHDIAMALTGIRLFHH